MMNWGTRFLALGALLLLIGVGPALLAQYIFPAADGLIPALLLVTITPLGAVSFILGLTLFLANRLRQR